MNVETLVPAPDSVPLDDLEQYANYLVELRDFACSTESQRVFFASFVEYQSRRAHPLGLFLRCAVTICRP